MEDSDGLGDAAGEPLPGAAPVQAATLVEGRLRGREAAVARAPTGAPWGRAEGERPWEAAGARCGRTGLGGRIAAEQEAGKFRLCSRCFPESRACRTRRQGGVCPRGRAGGKEPAAGRGGARPCGRPRGAARLASAAAVPRPCFVAPRGCRAPSYRIPLPHQLCLLAGVARLSERRAFPTPGRGFPPTR